MKAQNNSSAEMFSGKTLRLKGNHVLKGRKAFLFSINYVKLLFVPRKLSDLLHIDAEEYVD
jgi:hypothetical protein